MNGSEPWYRRVMRWGQTNIREIDAAPGHYDLGFWIDHWQQTRVGGIIVNAGGIVAYYPSAYELHRRSPYLGDRDLFGEVAEAARTSGIVVVARMDWGRLPPPRRMLRPPIIAIDSNTVFCFRQSM